MNTKPDTSTKTNFWSTGRLTVMALMVALLAASSYITIPLPFSSASITAQTLVVNFIGMLLLPQEALTVMVTWILVGLVGVPVFSGGTAGPAKLFGPGGGYIFGFLVAVLLISLFCRRVKDLRLQTAFLIIIGIPVIYLFGAVQMQFVTRQPWGAILIQSVLPFIPLDIVKCLAAAALAKAIRRTGLFSGNARHV
ncbi:MAG: biotin transporter BioY [Clostridiales bacterium]|nr:biotin transporter BioY [Clostridiales bacterium]